uniref:Bifunctional inhibitor/plant lipid transfer protein/seed storage helical domain-containing protein n=1 Tax=Oryza nivara TaxID=4536 RepID=A0A0E0HBD6_ORYNI
MAVPRRVHVVLFVYITVILTAVAVHAQRDTCGAELNTFLPAPFNSSALLCKSVWNSFILRLAVEEGCAPEHTPRTICQPPKHTLQKGKPSTEPAIAMRDRSPPGQQHQHDTNTLKRRPHEGCDAERRRRHPSKELDKVFT